MPLFLWIFYLPGIGTFPGGSPSNSRLRVQCGLTCWPRGIRRPTGAHRGCA